MDVILLGLSLGLGAGLAPGPLVALVIRSTIRDGFGAGVRVAFSPLLTDLPIIVGAVVVAASVPDVVLGGLGIVGGAFVLWLGIDGLRSAADPLVAGQGDKESSRSYVVTGALTNILSPHPWVFWITVGAPILRQHGIAGGLAFLVAFYVLLIGSKVAIAGVLHLGRERILHGGRYATVQRTSALLLVATGIVLAIEGSQTVAHAIAH